MRGRVLLPDRHDHQIAWLAALAVTLHVLESALPMPVPGVKPGIANIITVLVLCQMGLVAAIWVSALRVVVGSLVLGTFLSPTFVLSLGGAICALMALAMGILYNKINRPLPLGPVGLSLLAALGHIFGQLACAYFLFIPHAGLLKLMPLLLAAAVGFGLINGVVTYKTLAYLEK